MVLLALMTIIHISEPRASPTHAQDTDSNIAALRLTLERLEGVLRYYQQLVVRNLLAETDLPRLGKSRKT